MHNGRAERKKKHAYYCALSEMIFLPVKQAGPPEAAAKPSLYDAMRKTCLIYAAQRARSDLVALFVYSGASVAQPKELQEKSP